MIPILPADESWHHILHLKDNLLFNYMLKDYLYTVIQDTFSPVETKEIRCEIHEF